MMIKIATLTLAVLAAAAPPLAVEPAPAAITFSMTLSESGKVIAEPRLNALPGQPARFLVDDGKGNGWSAELVATPDSARPGMAAVEWKMSVMRASANGGTRSVRRIDTILAMKMPGRAWTDLPATDTLAPVHVELAILPAVRK
ncbi:hypothetical protein [uncultured Sphingomonas sp.]|uniref:hypothetical protein n=1 Tax=uncultured Sphingomonas sp. TaxID=158754 RepID=UPI0035CB451C